MISGWLKKKSSASVLGKHIWHTRYFVLSSFELEYYKSKKDAEDGKPPTGRIPLRRVKQVVFVKNRGATRFDLVCSGVTFIFQADTQELATEWVEVLNTVREEARASPVDQEESKNPRFWKEDLKKPAPGSRGQKIDRPRIVSEFDTSDKPAALATTNWFAFVNGRYLPFIVRERFHEEPSPLQKPEIEYFPGACAFIDISGFTKLSEYLVEKHGARQGAELLNKYISGYFDRLINVVYEFGGDIIKFAGDAMLVMWRNKYVYGEGGRVPFDRRQPPPKHVASAMSVVLSQLVQKKGESEKITQSQDELSLLRPHRKSVPPSTPASRSLKSPKDRPMTAIGAAAAAAATIKLGDTKPEKKFGTSAAAAYLTSRGSQSTPKDATKGGGSANVTPRGSTTEVPSPRNSHSGRTNSPPSSKDLSKHSRGTSQSSNGDGRTSVSQTESDFDVLPPPPATLEAQQSMERGSVNYKSANDRSKNAKKKLQSWLGSGKDQVAELLLRCVACNLALIQELDNYQPSPGVDPLKLHTGVSAGTVVGMFVGGVAQEWLYYIAGDPIDEISECANEAKSGECFLPRYWLEDPLIRHHLNVSHVPNSENVKVNMLYKPPPLFNYRRVNIEEKSEAALKMFVPSVIKKAADAETASSMVAEFRTVFVLFIKLDVPSYYASNVLEVVQTAIQIVQDAVVKFNGSIARLLADDKGTRFKIVFGMPTQAHDDDGTRCVLAALEMQTQLCKINIPNFIGMATGNVLCCMAGSEKRCEYTAVGFKVIMAARMMSSAHKVATRDGLPALIFCDGDVEAKCKKLGSSRFTFKSQPSLSMKGIALPVPTFTPVYTRGPEQASLEEHMKKHKQGSVAGHMSYGEMERLYDAQGLPRKRHSVFPRQFFANVVGRKFESEQIFKRFQSILLSHHQQIVVIEAESGMGKSALCYDFVDHVQRVNPKVIFAYGMAELSERDHDYFIFGVLLEQILKLEKMDISKGRRERTEHIRAIFDLLHKLNLAEEAANSSSPEPASKLEQLRSSYSEQQHLKETTTVKDRREKKMLLRGGKGGLFHAPNPLDFASLLNNILHTDFSETPVCKALTPVARQARIVDLICSLLEKPALVQAIETTPSEEVYQPKKNIFSPLKDSKPLTKKSISSSDISSAVGCLIMEDCHNLDAQSWRLLSALTERQKPNLMILLTTRPLTADSVEEGATEIGAASFDMLTGMNKPRNGAPALQKADTPPSPNFSPSLASFTPPSSFLGSSPPRSGSGFLLPPSSSGPRFTVALSKRFAQSGLSLDDVLLLRNVPDDELPLTVYRKICHLSNTFHVVLKPLSVQETAEYANVCFGGRSIQLPPHLQSLIWAKAQGHPLYIQEICRSLQDKKSVEVTKEGKVTCDQAALDRMLTIKPGDDMFIPTDIQRLIVGRIDRLPLDHQLVVKIASVIGSDIKFSLLCKVVPMEGSRDDREVKLKAVCERLVKKGIFFQPSNQPEPPKQDDETPVAQNSEEDEDIPKQEDVQKQEDIVYSFVQGYLREAAYAMLPHDQCQAIHDDIAHYYEYEYARPVHLRNDEGRPFLAPSYSNYVNLIANHYSLGATQHSSKLIYFFTLAARRAASKQDFKQVYQWYDQVHQSLIASNNKCFCLLPSPSFQDFKKTDLRFVEAHMNIAWAYTFAGGDTTNNNPMWKCLEYLTTPLPPVADINNTYCCLTLEVIREGLFNPQPQKPEAVMRTFLSFQLLETLVAAYLEEDFQRRGEPNDSDGESDEEDYFFEQPHSNKHRNSHTPLGPAHEMMQDEPTGRKVQLVWAACKMTSLAASLGNPTLVAICLAYCWVLADQLGWKSVASTAMTQLNELLKMRDEEGEIRSRSSSGGDVKPSSPSSARRTSRDDSTLRLGSRKAFEAPAGLRKTDSPKFPSPSPRPIDISKISLPPSPLSLETLKLSPAASNCAATTTNSAIDGKEPSSDVGRGRSNVLAPREAKPALLYVYTLADKTIEEFSRYQPPYLQPYGLFLKNQVPFNNVPRGSSSRSAPPSPLFDPVTPLNNDPPSLSLARQLSIPSLSLSPSPSPSSSSSPSPSIDSSSPSLPSLTITTTPSSPISISSAPIPSINLSVPGTKAKSPPPPPPAKTPPPPPTSKTISLSTTSTSTTSLATPKTPQTTTTSLMNSTLSPTPIKTMPQSPSTSHTGSLANHHSTASRSTANTPISPSLSPTPSSTQRKSLTNSSAITTTTTATTSTTIHTLPTPTAHSTARHSVPNASSITTTSTTTATPRMSVPTLPHNITTSLTTTANNTSTTPSSIFKRNTVTQTTQTTAPNKTATLTLTRQPSETKPVTNPPPPAPIPPHITSAPGSFPPYPQGADAIKSIPLPTPTAIQKVPSPSSSASKQSPSSTSEPDGWTASILHNQRARIDAHADRSAIVLPLLSRPCPSESLADIVLLLSTATINQRRRALSRCRRGSRNEKPAKRDTQPQKTDGPPKPRMSR